MAAYPKRAGGNPKPRANRAWHARIRDGTAPQAMIDGTRRYAAFCTATGKVGTEFVQLAATFFGPDKPFLEPWDIPEPRGSPHEARQRVDAGRRDRDEFIDEFAYRAGPG